MESDGEQWKQIHKLDQSTIRAIYSLYQKPFFVEVRENLSEWIEARFLDTNLDANNLSHHPYILQFIGDLDAELKAKAVYLSTQDPNSFTIPVKLSIAANMISSGNPMHPITLFQHICHCLQTEREFIRRASMPQEINMADPTFSSHKQESVNCFWDMMTKCDDLKMKSSMIDEVLNKFQSYQEEFAIKANRLEIVEDAISRFAERGPTIPDKENFEVREIEKELYEKNVLERWILDQVANIDRERLRLQNLQLEFLEFGKTFQSKVLQCVSSWKEEQVAGSRHVISIDQIQQWFDGLVHEIINFNNQLKQYTTIEQNYSAAILLARNIVPSGNKQINVQEYQSQTTKLLNELIQHALIVESQPHQLLRRRRRIAVKVRFLIGRSLQISLAYQSLQASILNEAGVKEFISNNGSGALITCGELVNALQKFELGGGASGYVAEFRNIQIKAIEQKTRRSCGDSILDESYWFIFRAEFNYNEITHKVSALSVPVKITNHGSQDGRAWETLIWDAADKHQKSDSVPWTQLAQILNNRFTMMTKKGLTPEQMKFVEDRAFSVPGGMNPINGVKFITKSQFCKTNIPKMGFTFWNWFYEISELTSKHLCGNKFCKSGPWQDDLIIGFISRERAVKILENIGKPGTFLLRFSNSQLGAITVTYVHSNGRDVRSVFPFTDKDLTYRPLAERILDIENLLTLYPNKEKVQSFEPYVLHPPKDDYASLKGYVRSELRTVLKDQEALPHHFEKNKSTSAGKTHPLDRDSRISDYSSSAGDSPEERVNSVESVSEASDHWINSYYPDPVNESPDRSGDGFSIEDYMFNSEDISDLTESIQNMNK